MSSTIRRPVSRSWPGVVDRPVLVVPTWEDRAGLAAPHRDDDVAALDEIGVELRRHVPDHPQPTFGEHLRDHRVDVAARFGPGGADIERVAAVVLREHVGGDGAARVVDAGEQDAGRAVHTSTAPPAAVSGTGCGCGTTTSAAVLTTAG